MERDHPTIVPVRLVRIGFIAGLGLFVALVLLHGVREIGGQLAVAGVGLVAVVVFHLVPLSASALGWRALLGRLTRPPARMFVRARWVAESINHLLPAAQLGGNVVRAQSIARCGVPGPLAGASVVVDVTLHLLAQILFTLLGLALLLLHVGGRRLAGPATVSLVAAAGTVVALYAIQRRGVFGALARAVPRVVRARGWSVPAARAAAMDAWIGRLWGERRQVAVSGVWHGASWLLGAGETWIALRVLGHPVSVATALVLESLGEAVRTAAFPIPGALGVQEGGLVMLGGVFGLGPDVSIALSLAKRVRELCLGIPGLVVWQIEARRARASGAAAERSDGATWRGVLRRGSRALDGPGRRLVPLSARRMLAAARRRTGLQDFGDPAFVEPLDRLVRSLESEARLNLVGRIAARQDLTDMLANRLRMERDRRRHRGIAAETIRRPLFITGLPRSGSTFLHGLLAQDPANRVPLHWEVRRPSPPPERATYATDPRIARAARDVRWFLHLAPEFRTIHPVGARLPEECVVVLSHSFLSFQFSSLWFVPAYHGWLGRQDLRPAYRCHRRFLQQLQWRCAGERWVLKAPPHLPGLRALFAIYPDAEVIVTHRDPLEVVASVASLHVVLRRTFSDFVDPHQVGAEVTRMLADDVRRGLEAREGGCAPPEQFADVGYAELTADPLAVVRRIYRRFDLPLSADAEARMRRFVAANPKDAYGPHVYTLAQFGLEPDAERRRYREYGARWKACVAS